MLTATIDGQEVKMKKADVIRILYGEDKEKIIEALKSLEKVEELARVEKFRSDCEFAYRRMEENHDNMVYTAALKRIRTAVENHGIPRQGHLNDQAKRILSELDSPSYSHLLSSPKVRESYDLVESHFREYKHSKGYEMHLNHLFGVLTVAKKQEKHRTEAVIRKATPELEVRAQSA